MKSDRYAKLRGAIREKYGTQAEFAKAMQMHPSSLNQKLCGARDWTREEIERSQKLLSIPPGELSLYFF